MNNYVVCTEKSWNVRNFNKCYRDKENWHLITSPKEYDVIKKLEPRYVFVPHWSWIFPEDIWRKYEVVIFHMTDLPFGKGMEPLQHLISSGLKETKVSAIRCVKNVDAGDIYMKRPMSLYGSAEEIYIRCSDIVFKMIEEIASNELKAETSQIGEPTYFIKRTLEDCRIPDTRNLIRVYDWIRMQDAETYNPAFLETDKLRLEFNRASLRDGYVEATVRIKSREMP